MRDETEAVQTAMWLTQQEWDDLALICRNYRACMEGWNDKQVVRRVELCKRLEDAA